jgi:Tfp pilus assembly protein PilE
MGQQQLLLVILVTILVGIATVVAINTFGSSNINANRDAVRNDIAAIATAAQAWYIKPEMLGGGNNSFEGLTFEDIGFAADSIYNSGLTASNLNGVYVLGTGTAGNITVTATPSTNTTSDNPITITGTIEPGDLSLAETAVE